MRFIDLVTVADQTVVITPRLDGQILRLGSVEVVTDAGVPARVFGTGTVEVSEGWWDDCGIFEGVYDGPAFTGDTGTVLVDGVERRTQWDGTPGQSTSSTTDMPPTVQVTVERSRDGDVWEPVEGAGTFMDWESPSYGDIRYRATAFTVEGAVAVTEIIVAARSGAIWLSAGPGFAQTCRFALEPRITITPSRARTVKEYAGRSLPVAYVGEAVNRVVEVSGTVTDSPVGREWSSSVEDIQRLAQDTSGLHQYRDPNGRVIVGSLEYLEIRRTARNYDAPAALSGMWTYEFRVNEATEA